MLAPEPMPFMASFDCPSLGWTDPGPAALSEPPFMDVLELGSEGSLRLADEVLVEPVMVVPSLLGDDPDGAPVPDAVSATDWPRPPIAPSVVTVDIVTLSAVTVRPDE